MDNRLFAPATQRNRQPIVDVLTRVLPNAGTVLEIASGTGEHGVFFAPLLSPRYWLPSDRSDEYLNSISAWQDYAPSDYLLPPIGLDVNLMTVDLFDHPRKPEITAIVNINMIHISAWSACEGLLNLAEGLLPAQGLLYLYGPFKQNDSHTSTSNAEFDRSLQLQNPAWGVRNLEDVISLAQEHHLEWEQTIPMPANNLSVIFRKRSD